MKICRCKGTTNSSHFQIFQRKCGGTVMGTMGSVLSVSVTSVFGGRHNL